MSFVKKSLIGIAAVAVLTAITTPPVFAQKIAISWSAFQEERWAKDRTAFLTVFDPAGFEVIESDAQNSPERQNADIENLITQQPDFLIVIATDTVQVISAVQAALDEGIPVLGYDRLIAVEGVQYTTFDNVEVGRIQAREVLKQQPSGNYVFIKGNPGDPNAFFVHGGQLYIVSRIKDLIVAGGRNIYPDDVELAVQEGSPAFRSGVGAAFAIDRAATEGVVMVQEVFGTARDTDADVLLFEARRAITSEFEMAPAAVVLVRDSSLPRTSAGKIPRHLCRDLYLSDELEVLAAWPDPPPRSG